MKFKSIFGMIAVALLWNVNAALAHFPWIVLDQEGKVLCVFGEDPTQRTYACPESLAEAKFFVQAGDGQRTQIQTTAVDTASLVGLVSDYRTSDGSLVFATVKYGVYHGTLLNYYCAHQCLPLPNRLPSIDSQPLPMDLCGFVVNNGQGVDVHIYWQGKPLANAEVQLLDSDGAKKVSSKTDFQGAVPFGTDVLGTGLNAIIVGHKLEGQSGELDGESFGTSSNYLTLTFDKPTAKSTLASSEATQMNVNPLPALPYGITSFGAARIGQRLYVYGGHTGSAHSYSRQEQSNELICLDLEKTDAGWEVLSKDQRLQGLALVAYQQKLICVGGFSAKNEEGGDHDLHSVAGVRVFDTQANQWSDLPALSAPRSSHDAMVLNDKLYVVGGWQLDGLKQTQWHSSALSLDLADTSAGWQELAVPQMQRRALVLAAHQGKLFAIGGMDAKGGPTRGVKVYNPASDQWSEGPSLLGAEAMQGFGAAAWSVDGQLVVTSIDGAVQVLSEDMSKWIAGPITRDARFFHRLLPFGKGKVVSIGGANMESGKFLEPEVISLR